MTYREIFERTYKGKKVFVTGHTGFKGSWLITWLHQLGAEIKGYALEPDKERSLYKMIDGDKLCDSVIDDIRNKERLKEAVTAFQPDFIFHLAAQPLVRRSYEMPLYTFEVNVNGTANLLEKVRELKNPCTVVVITTDKVYENRETDYAYKETDKLGGYDPYSASKAAAEIVVSSYRDSFFNIKEYDKHKKAIATARAGNVIGGGDWSTDRIIPDIIKAFEAGQPVTVRNPNAVRPWQHVVEPLSGYLLLGARLTEDPARYSGAWNFGPESNDVLTVQQLVETAIVIWGKGSYSNSGQKSKVHEAGLLHLDINKAKDELSWKPKFNSLIAIEICIKEYKELLGNNASIIRDNINSYFK